jgi:hypothetical protein
VVLRAPRPIGKNGFPTVLTGSVVDAGLGPSHVVADMETPGFGERDCTFAESVDRDDGEIRCGLRVGKAKRESEKQEHERVDNEWPTNAHLECIVRPTSRGSRSA